MTLPEAVLKVYFYRGGAEAQRKCILIINSLRLCVFAVIFYLLLLIQPLEGEVNISE
jgi:hypothetical protein